MSLFCCLGVRSPSPAARDTSKGVAATLESQHEVTNTSDVTPAARRFVQLSLLRTSAQGKHGESAHCSSCFNLHWASIPYRYPIFPFTGPGLSELTSNSERPASLTIQAGGNFAACFLSSDFPPLSCADCVGPGCYRSTNNRS